MKMQVFIVRRTLIFSSVLFMTTIIYWYNSRALPEWDSFCKCRRRPKLAENRQNQMVSMCSMDADFRGSGQKVISFSVFGKNPLQSGFVRGIGKNLRKIREIYPVDYVMRLYFNSREIPRHSEFHRMLCSNFCSHQDYFDLCDVQYLEGLAKSYGMLWRFAPMVDPLVQEFHSRDLDSTVSQREVDAVNDWIETKYSFHIMRDNPYHRATILGGMFGIKFTSIKLKNKTTEVFQKMIQESISSKTGKGFDQEMLDKFLWPLAKNDMVAHDSYLCDNPKYENPLNRPWPSPRVNGPNFTDPREPNFVGSNGGRIFLDPDSPGEPCPEACRPETHKDWILC